MSSVPITLAIEQPELHLHPSLQARVAEMFMEAIAVARKAGIDLRLIVETHSETIVNTIGEYIYKNAFAVADVGVIIFEKDKSSKIKVTEVSFDSEGILENWPAGFFSAPLERINADQS